MKVFEVSVTHTTVDIYQVIAPRKEEACDNWADATQSVLVDAATYSNVDEVRGEAEIPPEKVDDGLLKGRIHHDIHGWYFVKPGEEEPADGSSLGFDGRKHYTTREEAIEAA